MHKIIGIIIALAVITTNIGQAGPALSTDPSDSIIRASSPIIRGSSPYDKLSTDVVTPHIKWATPLQGGRIKTLVVSHVSQREVVELAQRLSIDCRIMMMNRGDSTYFAKSMLKEPDANIDTIFKERLAEEYDLIILASIKWSALPEYARLDLRKKIENGAGLIYINPEKSEEVAAFLSEPTIAGVEYVYTGVPLRSLPVIKSVKQENLLGFGEMKKGRVVTITYPTAFSESINIMTPDLPRLQSNYYEYIFSLIAKASCWAVKREPETKITKLTATTDDQGTSLQFVINSPAPAPVELEFAVRDDQNNLATNFTTELVLQAGANELTQAVGWLKSGTQFLDLWIRDKGDVIDWSSVGLNIHSGNSISELSADQEYYAPGDLIKTKAVFTEPPAGATICTLGLYDNYGRLINQTVMTAPAQEQVFNLKIKETHSILMHLRAELRTTSGRLLCTKTKSIPVPRKTRDDYCFAMWSAGVFHMRNYQGKYIMEAFNRHSVDAFYGGAYGNESLEEMKHAASVINSANKSFIPYMFAMASRPLPESGDPERPVRHKCYTDPAYRGELATNIVRNALTAKAHGPSVYSMAINGEIGRYDDYCFSPTCLADFIVFLKEKYGDLATLNQHWRSNHQSWDTVKPMTFTQADKSGNYATWVDHRLHMERVFADVCAMLYAKIKEIDPNACIGMDELSCINSFSGHDWVQLSKILDYTGSYMCPERFEQREVSRSLINQKPGFSGLWMGTYNQTEGYNRYVPWYSLMKGGNSLWWWLGFSTPSSCTRCAIDPGLNPLKFFAYAAEEVREIKQGIGKLLINSQRQSDKVAVFYSPLSVHAATIVDKADRKKNSQYYIHLCFIYVLNELGLQYEFITDEQILAGKLEQDGYKALFLPSARALSSKMAETLKAYTANGGMLVANEQPGIMDENCHQRETSPLAGVFHNFANPMKVKSYEKGHSLWLDDVVNSYYPRKDNATNRAISANLRELLGRVGIAARATLKKPDNSDLGESEIAFFKSGDIEYFFLMRDYNLMEDKNEVIPWLYRYHGYTYPEDAQAPQPVTITLPRVTHLYNIRQGKYLGQSDTIQTSVLPALAQVYAMLPYQVEGLKLTLDKQEYQLGDELQYTAILSAKTNKFSPHVFRVDLVDPAGKILEHLSENIIVSTGGQHVGTRLVALNEEQGNWKIRVRDVATGFTAESAFQIK